MVKLDFGNSVKQAIEIVKLNGKVAENVSKDKNATLNGILIIAIGAFLSQALNLEIITIVSTLIIGIIGYFIVIGIMHIVARLFGGKAKFIEYFRTESHAAVLGWLGILSIIPFLGGIINIIVGIWGFVISVMILENVHKLTRGKAIIVVLLPVVVMIFLIAGSIAYFGTVSPETLLLK